MSKIRVFFMIFFPFGVFAYKDFPHYMIFPFGVFAYKDFPHYMIHWLMRSH